MSEKRTKIGQSHTSGAISKYGRAAAHDTSSDSSAIQPKRSKTSEPCGLVAGGLSSQTLHRNFKSNCARAGGEQTDVGKPMKVQKSDVNGFRRVGSIDSVGGGRMSEFFLLGLGGFVLVGEGGKGWSVKFHYNSFLFIF